MKRTISKNYNLIEKRNCRRSVVIAKEEDGMMRQDFVIEGCCSGFTVYECPTEEWLKERERRINRTPEEEKEEFHAFMEESMERDRRLESVRTAMEDYEFWNEYDLRHM